MGSTKAKYIGSQLDYYDAATFERTARFAPVQFSDDFIGAGVVIPAAASAESGVAWVKKIVGAAPPTVVISDDAVNGIVACTLTSTSEKQNAELYMNDNQPFSVLQGLVFEAVFSPSVLPTGAAEMVIGVISAWADGLDNATYSAFVTLDGSGEIFCESDDNVTDASATSGITLVANDLCVVRIDATDYANGIRFYVNGARVAESTTFAWAASAANSKVQPVAGCYKASGTGVGTLLVDKLALWQNRT